MKELILGGARSGKSALAQARAEQSGLGVTFFATAQAFDEEMRHRIERHRRDRPPHWRTVETPIALAATLRTHHAPDRCLLVDCLTLWLTNLLLAGEQTLQDEQAALLETLDALQGRVIFVSNEVGWGIVPVDPLARRFRDLSGRLHQDLAARCDRVTLTVAGLPLTLK